MKTATVALGGNSLIRPGDKGTAEEQFQRMGKTCEKLASMITRGYELVLTHGNGPQVGNILLRNELSSSKVPSLPLDVCGAESQGQIGYMFQQTLRNELIKRDIDMIISSIITQVVVDEDDPAFKDPTKFIGPSYTKEETKDMEKKKNWVIKKTAEDKYRRVVPSPEPKEIVESEIIHDLVFAEDKNYVVIGAGGGGVPVIKKNGMLKGVEGVIDKDKATSVLASEIDETFLVLLTNVEKVFLDYGKESEEPLDSVSIREAKRYLDQGHFPPGSMGPKVEASIDFLKNGGEKVLITTPEKILEALDGKTGTFIHHG